MYEQETCWIFFFSTLESEMAKVESANMESAQIWNMDESGFHLEHTPQRVVGRKGANTEMPTFKMLK